MWKQMVASGLGLMVLVGCDNSSKPETLESPSLASEVRNTETSTTLYLPGGAGLDFSRSPVAVVESKWKDKDVITYAFEFDDATYEEVDGSISPILLGEGYARTEADNPQLIKYTTYKKGDAVVAISYADNVRDGFTKNLLLKVWWVK
ncbi:hypothetical protein P8H27_12995 [Pseudomonas sp. sp1636]|uniref:hypothetical protein n=1 Tax=Pseudomonas sp. sp1636 TaxID=3036707 RepID=UPI0025A66801|nr:hypothetical protein [Pseudomonas sp. sp1636]MDM8349805.1 hypothetical protein [Pseudomonas sp. sp1636]